MDQNTGRIGEDYAAEWLVCHGYSIVARNYHSRFGEIDIIAKDSQYIVFVEVKTRESGAMVLPVETVTRGKQRRIIQTALCFLRDSQTPLQPRFDLAAVTTVSHEPLGLQYYANAFGC